jgi:hypothetical protein
MSDSTYDGLAGLEEINAWIKTHLSVDERGSPGRSTRDFQRDFVSARIKQLCERHQIEPHLVTVRSLFQTETNYLRPIYSEPGFLHIFFSNAENQVPFDYTGDPFSDALLKFKLKSDGYSRDKSKRLIGAVYRLDDLLNKPQKRANHSGFKFRPRILRFLDRMQEQHRKQGATVIAKLKSRKSFCLIIGVESQNSGKRKSARFEHFSAIYCTTKHADPDWQSFRPTLFEAARSIFHGIELIREFDSALFKNEGLRLVSNLTARFASPDIPSADKMSFLIEKLKQLLSRHLIGVDIAAVDTKRSKPSIYYVATQFGRPDENNGPFRPSFQIYPLCYAQGAPGDSSQTLINPVRSFLVAHSKIPSIAKFLVMRYFAKMAVTGGAAGSQRVTLSPEFKALFSDDAIRRADKLATAGNKFPDQIHLSSLHDERLWKALNHHTFEGEPERNSVVAFVIEGGQAAASGEHGESIFSLPLGVLVIESSAHDAFSDSDITSLRAVAAGLAPLVRGISHRNASIDYEYAIRKTFQIDTQERIGQIALGDFLFQILRVDAAEYENIMKYAGVDGAAANKGHIDGKDAAAVKLLSNYTSLSYALLRKIWNSHRKILVAEKDRDVLGEQSGSDDHRTDDTRTATNAEKAPQTKSAEEENKLLRARRDAYLTNRAELAAFYNGEDASAIYEFFAACPSNYVWSGYLRSIPQALGDRAVLLDPEFDRVGPGFSADALFMATIDGELRQIVKLSTWQKLDRERTNYRNFVRYKIPFAARIPAAAYAVESRGYEGMRAAAELRPSGGIRSTEPGDDSFGALVSDLVDGKAGQGSPNTFSFLDLAADQLKHNLGIAVPAQNPQPKPEEILEALEDHFVIGVSLWRELTAEQKIAVNKKLGIAPGQGLVAAAMSECFRLNDFNLSDTTRISVAVRSLKTDSRKSAFALLNGLYKWIHAKQDKQDLHHLSFDGPDEAGGELERVIKKIQELLKDPTPQFAVGIPNLDPVRAIIHGDLNARNLTWAQAFKRFFIIDFEHVGYGLLGVDQFRLVMSLLSDLWSASARELTSRADTERLKSVGERIGLLIIFLDRLTETMANNSFGPEKAIEGLELASLKDDFVVKAINRVLSTIRSTPAIENPGSFQTLDRIGADFWKYVAFCAATKEFEYSLRDVNDGLIEVLWKAAEHAKEGDSVAPGVLLFNLQTNEASDDQRRIGARFISSFCCVVATLPTRGNQ